jgi:hypothetical protein
MAAARTLPSHERPGVLETYRSRGRRTATCGWRLENLAPAHEPRSRLMIDASFSRLRRWRPLQIYFRISSRFASESSKSASGPFFGAALFDDNSYYHR